MTVARYFLQLSYKGTNYHGWQVQENANTVQAQVQKALSTALGKATGVVGCGRTDTGVHASEFYAHFDCTGNFSSQDVLHKVNTMLPSDIAIRGIQSVDNDTHARYSSISRRYKYYIHQKKAPFLQGRSYYWRSPLEWDAMNEAAGELLVHTDFQCFSKVKTQVKTFDCAITEAHWRWEDEQLVFTIKANRFLRGMVRAIVGTLLKIGEGRSRIAYMKEVILSKDRSVAGAASPAHGLYLTEVGYPQGTWK